MRGIQAFWLIRFMQWIGFSTNGNFLRNRWRDEIDDETNDEINDEANDETNRRSSLTKVIIYDNIETVEAMERRRYEEAGGWHSWGIESGM